MKCQKLKFVTRQVPRRGGSKMPLKGKFAYLPNGKKVELFPVGVLATAVGRTSQAIRKWEVAGIIPPSFFKDKSGKRLYTQEQIDIISGCAERAHISQGKSISRTSFKKWVHEDMEKLRKKYVRKRGTKLYEKVKEQEKGVS